MVRTTLGVRYGWWCGPFLVMKLLALLLRLILPHQHPVLAPSIHS